MKKKMTFLAVGAKCGALGAIGLTAGNGSGRAALARHQMPERGETDPAGALFEKPPPSVDGKDPVRVCNTRIVRSI